MKVRMMGMPLLLLAAVSLALPRPLRADKAENAYKRGVKFRDKGDLENAQHEFEEALQRRPDYLLAKTLLGLTHFELGKQFSAHGDLDSAIAEFREAVRLEPDEAYWHFGLGALLIKKDLVQEAFNECMQAARLSPDDAGLEAGCGFKKNGQAEGIAQQDKQGPEITANAPARVDKDVSAPTPTYKPEPAYSEKARAARYQGHVVLYIVVNAQGEVEAARVVKPLGLGLDQRALQTVRTWKFRPGTRNGTPVKVRVMVDVAFRLY